MKSLAHVGLLSRALHHRACSRMEPASRLLTTASNAFNILIRRNRGRLRVDWRPTQQYSCVSDSRLQFVRKATTGNSHCSMEAGRGETRVHSPAEATAERPPGGAWA